MATRVEILRPPDERLSLVQWAQRSLFDGAWNTILTLITAVVLFMAFTRVAGWIATARWGVVTENLRFWLVGLMPVEYVPRALWAGGLIAIMAILTYAALRAKVRVATLAAAWGGIIIAVLWLMSPIRLDQIGGLYLTLLLALVGISFSFPIGMIVGVGRVSTLPVIRTLSTVYIEVIRGIPFITVLLWFSVFVSLVSGDALTRVQRAMIAMTIFTSAYVGEIVRAGIQSVPRGQVEAARAVGLSPAQTMRLIVLPQAIKNMIPALVGQFISLFKDTSLAVIIGLSELVGTGRALLSITRYLHDVREVYVFLIAVYFVFSYAMSYGSRRLERKLGLGER
jgi:His/Glu/Gln/Arg/opine family amino acid ABC transporter permease subunit